MCESYMQLQEQKAQLYLKGGNCGHVGTLGHRMQKHKSTQEVFQTLQTWPSKPRCPPINQSLAVVRAEIKQRASKIKAVL